MGGEARKPGRGGWWLTAAALVAVVAVNWAAFEGIAMARRSALADSESAFATQVSSQAGAIERALAAMRADLAFVAAATPEERTEAGAASAALAEIRRASVENALLLFLRNHPEVIRVIVRGSSGRVLVHTGRRGGVPLIWVSSAPTGLEGAATAPGRRRITTSVSLHDASGHDGLTIEGEIEPSLLLGPEEQAYEARPACSLSDERGGVLAQRAALPISATPETANELTAAATINAQDWSAPGPWALRCSQASPSVGLTEPLTAGYRRAVALNLGVMALALLLGGFAVQQSRRRDRLEAEAREDARVREVERRLFHAERLSTVGRLAAGLAHEINNPLEGMTNYLALVKDALARDDRAAAERALDGVRQGLERAAGVVRQVLAQAGREPAVPPPADLNQELRDAAQFVASRPEFRAVRFSVELAEGTLTVRGGETMLGQVAMNLMLNACEAQPDGGEVHVTSRREGGFAVADVADRGPGIAEADRAKVFEAFFSTKGSLGLGLSVCHAIVRQQGGELSCLPREGGGTIFRLRLPIEGA